MTQPDPPAGYHVIIARPSQFNTPWTDYITFHFFSHEDEDTEKTTFYTYGHGNKRDFSDALNFFHLGYEGEDLRTFSEADVEHTYGLAIAPEGFKGEDHLWRIIPSTRDTHYSFPMMQVTR